MNKSQVKLINYFEKRLQETDRWIERIKKYSGKNPDDLADLHRFQGARGELLTNLKYVRGSRWMVDDE